MTGPVLLAGGGTGGHVFPSLATASALAAVRPALPLEFVGTSRGLESRLVPAAGWELHLVESMPLARGLSLSSARLPRVLARAVREVRQVIEDRQAVAAVCFGGYASVPLALAARRDRLPLVVHEQNAVPGVANRLASRFAQVVAVSFAEAAPRFKAARVELTGNPVRPELAAVDRRALRPEALARFGLDPGRRTLLAFGGSLGARRINQAVIDSAARWRDPARLQILHAAGKATYADTAAAWQAAPEDGPRIVCEEFIDRMDLAYAAADVVVCRAGASSIAELTAMGLPAVLVPYPHATADHQTSNARALQRAGAAVLVADHALDGDRLVAAAEPLLADDQARAAMAAAAAGLGTPDAAARVAALVLAELDAVTGEDA